MKRHILSVAGIVAATTALALAGCSGSGSGSTASTGASGDAASGAAGSSAGPAGGSYTIGISQYVTHTSLDAAREGFKAAIEDAGLDVTFDEQNAQGDQATVTSIASTFASGDYDLVLAVATPSAQAMAQATTTLPVLFTAVTDPVAAQLVDSLEAPGGNVTGTTDMNPVADQIGLVTQLVPDAKTVGIVYSSGEVNSEVQVELAKKAAAAEGLTVKEATVTNSSEVQQAAQSLGDVDAIYIPTDNVVVSALSSVLQVAESAQIPVIAGEADSVRNGAVATYGIDYTELGRQTGEMAVKILTEGADPATLAVEQQSTFALTVNTTAAAAMGVTVPDDLLAKATVVE